MMNFLKNMSPEQQQFLLTMGSSILSQPYTNRPQGAMEPIGRGMMLGNEAYQNALILKRAEEDRQELKADRQTARVDKLESWGKDNLARTQFNKSLEGADPATRRLFESMYAANPAEAAKTLWESQQPSAPVIGAGDMSDAIQAELRKLGPRPAGTDYTPEEYEAATAAVQADALARANANARGVPTTNERWQGGIVDQAIEARGTLMGKAEGIASLKNKVAYIRDLSGMIDAGGVGEETFQKFNSMAQNFGMPSLQSKDETALKDALMASQAGLVNDFRAAAPKDPQFSKADLEFFMKQAPGLGQSPAGRALMLQMIEAQANRIQMSIDYYANAEANGLSYEDTQRGYREMLKNMPVTHLVTDDGRPTEVGQQAMSLANSAQATPAGGGGGTHPPMVLNGVTYTWDEATQAYTD